jgi:hypothetical protein
MSAIVEMNIVEEIVALKARVAELEAAAKPKAAAEPKEPKEPKAKAEPKEPKAKAEPKAKKEKKALPSGEDGEPDASEYRIAAADVDLTTCVARLTDESTKDDRWSKAVYAEMQCGKKVHEDGDLCKSCAKKEEKYEDKAGAWKGRVTDDEPPSWLHMLGTAWAEKAKPTFKPSASAPASSAASVADDEEEGPSDAPAPKDKKAEAAAKKAEAAAKKEAAAAEKEAKKAAAEKEKEAKKEAAEKEKEAKKAAAEAKKAAAEAKKAEKPKPKAKAEKKAEVVEEAIEVEEEMETIGKVVYLLVNGNVYEYDAMAEKRGKYAGRRVENDEGEVSIDKAAAEVL